MNIFEVIVIFNLEMILHSIRLILLCFREGTTDTTRTMHFGTPTQHEKECFTLVLKVSHVILIKLISWPSMGCEAKFLPALLTVSAFFGPKLLMS